MYSFDPKDITKEKSLLDIYKQAFFIFPGGLQIFIVACVFICLAINSFLLEKRTDILLSNLRDWASFGFNFSITTLGFLIAGFTIFATLTKPKMMLAMMDHKNKKYNLPTLKYNFFVFIKVFISYISLAVIYAMVMILGQKGGFLSNAINYLFNIFDANPYAMKVLISKFGYTLIGSSLVYLLLQLKSFVFNIYMIVMNLLRWEYYEEINKIDLTNNGNHGGTD